MTKDEQQIEEAKKDVAEKGPDSQSEKARIDESVGEQERLDGNEDSQNAKDRVNESEGTQKADEKRAEEKKEERAEDDTPAWASKMISMLEQVVAHIAPSGSAEQRAIDEANDKAADNLADAFGAGAGTFPANAAEEGAHREITAADVAKTMRKIM